MHTCMSAALGGKGEVGMEELGGTESLSMCVYCPRLCCQGKAIGQLKCIEAF